MGLMLHKYPNTEVPLFASIMTAQMEDAEKLWTCINKNIIGKIADIFEVSLCFSSLKK